MKNTKDINKRHAATIQENRSRQALYKRGGKVHLDGLKNAAWSLEGMEARSEWRRELSTTYEPGTAEGVDDASAKKRMLRDFEALRHIYQVVQSCKLELHYIVHIDRCFFALSRAYTGRTGHPWAQLLRGLGCGWTARRARRRV